MAFFGLFGGAPSRADRSRAAKRRVLQDVRTVQGGNIGLDARGLDRLPGFYLDNPGAYTWSTSPYAPSNEYESAGFETSGYVGSGRGARRGDFYLFQKKQPQAPTIEYRTDPAQAERLKKLEEQLKIAQARPTITPEMVEYRKQADATLKAAEERLAQFAINKSAFETQQQEAAAAAEQREAAFQAAMKQREDIFAQESAASTADLQRRQGLFAKSMEEQRAALSGQQEAFAKSAAEREEAFQKMTIQQQEAFRKEQKEAEAAANRAAAVRSANQRQSELAQTIQIQPTDGATRRFAGTQGFRRRAAQFGTTSPYKGLGTIQSGMVNV